MLGFAFSMAFSVQIRLRVLITGPRVPNCAAGLKSSTVQLAVVAERSMTTWCLAGQRLSTVLRVAAFTVHRHSAYARVHTSTSAWYTRSRIVCGAAPAVKPKYKDAALKARQNSPPKKAVHDSFYAPDNVTFASLRTLPAVAEALHNGGFSTPSTVQVPCISVKITLLQLCELQLNNTCLFRSLPCLC